MSDMFHARQSKVCSSHFADYLLLMHLSVDVFESISPEFPYGVIPHENSTFGSVIDTYDCLRSTKAGSKVHIRGLIVLAIRHCLVGRKGLDRDKITRILSHDQVCFVR